MVDAHEDTREMCGCLLRRLHGLAVQGAATACDALRMVAESAPDIIVTEMALPGVDGYELCRRLREQAKMRATPIFSLTAVVMPQEVEKAYQAGCDVVLSKPCAPATLLETIYRLLPSLQPLPVAS